VLTGISRPRRTTLDIEFAGRVEEIGAAVSECAPDEQREPAAKCEHGVPA